MQVRNSLGIEYGEKGLWKASGTVVHALKLVTISLQVSIGSLHA